MQQPPQPTSDLLAGTVGVITGGASGIGAAAVRCFAAAGAQTIYSVDIVDVAGDENVTEGGANVIRVKADITKADEVEQLVRRVIKEKGRLDWFFANAGIVDFEVLSTTTPAALTRMLDVNVVGTFNCIQWAARGMMNTNDDKPQPGGSIIVTTSLASGYGGMGAPAYTVSKHAATGLVRAAAANLGMAKTRIRVNGVAPGPTATSIFQNNMAGMSPEASAAMMAQMAKMTPEAMAAIPPPEHVANTAVFLASNLAAGVNGEDIVVDQGLRQMPIPSSGLTFAGTYEPL